MECTILAIAVFVFRGLSNSHWGSSPLTSPSHHQENCPLRPCTTTNSTTQCRHSLPSWLASCPEPCSRRKPDDRLATRRPWRKCRERHRHTATCGPYRRMCPVLARRSCRVSGYFPRGIAESHQLGRAINCGESQAASGRTYSGSRSPEPFTQPAAARRDRSQYLRHEGTGTSRSGIRVETSDRLGRPQSA